MEARLSRRVPRDPSSGVGARQLGDRRYPGLGKVQRATELSDKFLPGRGLIKAVPQVTITELLDQMLASNCEPILIYLNYVSIPFLRVYPQHSNGIAWMGLLVGLYYNP